MVEAAAGDDDIQRSPVAHRTVERDVFRSPEASTGSTRP